MNFENLLKYVPNILEILKWLPTFIFIFIVVIFALSGLIKGKRKSKKRLIRSFIMFTIFFILYLLLCETKFGDTLIFTIINAITGGTLSEILGLSGTYSTLTGLINDYLTNFFNSTDNIVASIATSITDLDSYIASYVNYFYHIVFGIALYTIYFVLNLIINIFSFFFDKDKKAKARQNRKFMNGEVESTYRKQRISGMFIGILRGTINGLIIISFIGAILFGISGDKGDGKLKDVNFDNEYVNYGYKAYQAVDSYGTVGIFKVLNYFTVNDDEPIYLAIPDLLFSGKDTSKDLEEDNYSFNVREMICPITSYVKEVVSTVVETKPEDINGLINGELSTDDILNDYLTEVKTNPRVQSNLLKLIDDFPSEAYISKLTVSVIDGLLESGVATDILGDNDLSEPLKILFVKDYYSSYIPEEVTLSTAEIKTTLPYISLGDLVQVSDFSTILTTIFDYLNGLDDIFEIDSSDVTSFIPYVRMALECVQKLTIFNNSNSNLNPALTRLYYYVEVHYINAISSGSHDTLTSTEYINSLNNEIKWTNELLSLCDIFEDLILASNYLIDATDNFTDIDAKKILVSLFKDNRDEVVPVFNRLCEYIYDSNILAKLLSLDMVDEIVTSALKSIVPSYVNPSASYINVKDDDGNITEHGELYYLIKTVLCLTNEDIIDEAIKFIDMFTGSSDEVKSLKKETQDEDESTDENEDNDIDIEEILNSVKVILTSKDSDNNRIIDYLSSSDVLRSLVSSLALTYEEEFIYLSPSILETDANSNTVALIKESEYKTFLNSLVNLVTDDEIINVVVSFISDDDENDEEESDQTGKIISNISTLLENENINTVLESKIVQGSAGKIIYPLIDGIDIIKMPSTYSEPENWISTSTNRSELLKVIDSVKALNINFSELYNDGNFDFTAIVEPLLDMANDKNEEDNLNEVINTFLSSDLIYYTLGVNINLFTANLSFGGISLIIPDSCQYTDEENVTVVNKEELKYLLKALLALDIIEISTDETVNDDGSVTENRSIGVISDESLNEIEEGLSLYNYLLTNVVLNKDVVFNSTILDAALVSIIKSFAGEYIPDSLMNNPSKVDLTSSDPYGMKLYKKNNIWLSELKSFVSVIEELFYENIYPENESWFKYIPLISEGGGFNFDEISTKALLLFGTYNEQSNVDSSVTKIDLFLNSTLFLNVSSSIIDTFLISGDDGFIEEEAKELSKVDGIYSGQELKSLLAFSKIIGYELGGTFPSTITIPMTTTDERLGFDSIGFDKYECYLIRGIFSKMSKSTIESLGITIPSNAYMTDTNIYTKNEIQVILDILDGEEVTEIMNKALETKLEDVKNIIYYKNNYYDSNETAICKSYILLSVLSSKITTSVGSFLSIPKTVMNSNGCIEIEEVYNLLNAINELSDEDDMTIKYLIDHISTLFTTENIKVSRTLFKSKIINAKIISIITSSYAHYLKKSAYQVTTDYNDEEKIVYIAYTSESNNIVAAVNALGTDGKWDLSALNENFVLDSNNSSKIETMMNSSTIRYIVNEIIENKINNLGDYKLIFEAYLATNYNVSKSNEVVYVVGDIENPTNEFYSLSDTLEVINAIRSFTSNIQG